MEKKKEDVNASEYATIYKQVQTIITDLILDNLKDKNISAVARNAGINPKTLLTEKHSENFNAVNLLLLAKYFNISLDKVIKQIDLSSIRKKE